MVRGCKTVALELRRAYRAQRVCERKHSNARAAFAHGRRQVCAHVKCGPCATVVRGQYRTRVTSFDTRTIPLCAVARERVPRAQRVCERQYSKERAASCVCDARFCEHVHEERPARIECTRACTHARYVVDACSFALTSLGQRVEKVAQVAGVHCAEVRQVGESVLVAHRCSSL
jgi:hypothetical protein